jgi:phosphohistidine phosphatase
MSHTDRTLVLLRHSKSDWSVPGPDLRRPLAPRGRRQAPEAAQWLAKNLPEVDLAVVSPAARALETMEILSAEVAPKRTVVEDRVYAASAIELLDVISNLPGDAGIVVLVGHNPGMEELAWQLAGGYVPMKTSALAVFDVKGTWDAVARGTVTLRAAGRPWEDGTA